MSQSGGHEMLPLFFRLKAAVRGQQRDMNCPCRAAGASIPQRPHRQELICPLLPGNRLRNSRCHPLCGRHTVNEKQRPPKALPNMWR